MAAWSTWFLKPNCFWFVACQKEGGREFGVRLKFILCGCGVCVLDATGDKELLQNIPEIRDKFNILSKIGEGQFTDVALCSVKEEESPPTWPGYKASCMYL